MIFLEKNNIAIAASSLPIPVLNKKISQWNIKEIYVTTNSLGSTYEYLNQTTERVKIHEIGSSQIAQFLNLAILMLQAKIKKRKIYFFHECCFPAFDVLVGIIKPNSVFCPQVKMDSFQVESIETLRSTAAYAALSLLGLKDKFVLYSADGDNNQKKWFALSRKDYPDSVVSLPIEDSIKLRQINKYGRKESSVKRFLIIGGTDIVDNASLIRCYKLIVDFMVASGFLGYYKDHPNPDFRLHLNDARVSMLDALMPIELIEYDFDLVFSYASTSLIAYGSKSVSVARLIEDHDVKIDQRIRHLDSLLGGDQIHYPRSISEIRELLI